MPACHQRPERRNQMTRGLCESMKDIGADYIDYWQSVCLMSARFGIRVQDGFCSVVNTIDGEQPMAFGRLYQIPVRPEVFPSYLRMILDDHMLNSPDSDLMDVL